MTRSPRNTNLNDAEIQALKQLSSNKMITIKPADNGGNIVLLNNVQYIAICNEILKNQD